MTNKKELLLEAIEVLKKEDEMHKIVELNFKPTSSQIVNAIKVYNDGGMYSLTETLVYMYKCPQTTEIDTWMAMDNKERNNEINLELLRSCELADGLRGAYNRSINLNTNKESGKVKNKKDARNREIAKIKKELKEVY